MSGFWIRAGCVWLRKLTKQGLCLRAKLLSELGGFAGSHPGGFVGGLRSTKEVLFLPVPEHPAECGPVRPEEPRNQIWCEALSSNLASGVPFG